MVQIKADPKTNARTQLRKRAILESAARAFRRHGFHEASMREIAADLGMQVGNLYYYFESKQALLAYCQESTLDHLSALIARSAARADSAAARLHWIIVGHILCIHEVMPGSVAHLTLDPLPERDRARCVSRRDAYESALREIVRAGIESGDFRPVDPRVAVWTILGALNGTASWFRSEGAHSALALGFEMANQLLRGLVAPEAHFEIPCRERDSARAWRDVLQSDGDTDDAPSRRYP